MNRIDFLAAVLPPTGWYCALGIKGKKLKQTFHNTLADLDTEINALVASNHNCYFALASFKDNAGRTQENSEYLKAFFLDLDCGAGKEFADQPTALQALRTFLKEAKLPKPTIVNSGRGIHVYWPLQAAIAVREWRQVAVKLKALCAQHQFPADPAVTSDTARVLRAPETFNVKDADKPLAVEILHVCTPIDFADFKDALGVTAIDLSAARRPMDAVSLALLGNNQSRFKTILDKTIAKTGCAQIAEIVANQATTTEPMWRAGLSIATHCVDGAKAVHFISKGHPKYDHAATVTKAAAIQGPYTCDTFAGLNPSACTNCAHKGKIKSPIVLGNEIIAATPEDNKITVVLPPAVEGATAEVLTYVIPEYPFPFFRGRNGGIYIKGEEKKKKRKDEEVVEDDVPRDELVYENDFYMDRLVDDAEHGMCAMFRLHLPKEPVKVFTVPFRDMVAKDKLRDHIATNGVICSPKRMELMSFYVNQWGVKLQKEMKAEKSRTQFGWTSDLSSFIVGDKEISANKISYSPPSSTTIGLVEYFRSRGTIEGWKNIVNFYNRPGMEMQAFVMFTGFGSVLLPLLGTGNVQGGIISLVSEGSGTGKTTLLYAINSIFGHPKETMLIEDDTGNARISRAGVYRNIATTTDEVTNAAAKDLSRFIYRYLHGRDKNRMKSSFNVERANQTIFNSFCVLTGNSSINDKVYAAKAVPDGELARYAEFTVQLNNDLPKEETDAIFSKLFDHFGVAGPVFIQYVLNHRQQVADLLINTQRKVDREFGFAQRERYWSVKVTCLLVGGAVAKEAGLHDIDMGRVYAWAKAAFKEMLRTNRPAVRDPLLSIGEFLQEHVNDVLISNGMDDKRTGVPTMAIKEPRGQLLVRYEPDTKLLFISSKHFRLFCTREQIPYQLTLDELRAKKILVAEGQKKRMGKGTAVDVNILTIVLDNTSGLVYEAEANGAGAAGKDKVA
jgi:hypothetical protein